MRQLQLPSHVAAKAYRSPGAGEMAWRRTDLPEAFHALVEAGYAILGGEVWVVESLEGNWNGLIPCGDGSPPGVWSWDTLKQSAEESWRAYSERTLRESTEAVAEMKVEDEAAASVVPMLWFNVTSLSRDDV